MTLAECVARLPAFGSVQDGHLITGSHTSISIGATNGL